MLFCLIIPDANNHSAAQPGLLAHGDAQTGWLSIRPPLHMTSSSSATNQSQIALRKAANASWQQTPFCTPLCSLDYMSTRLRAAKLAYQTSAGASRWTDGRNPIKWGLDDLSLWAHPRKVPFFPISPLFMWDYLTDYLDYLTLWWKLRQGQTLPGFLRAEP